MERGRAAPASPVRVRERRKNMQTPCYSCSSVAGRWSGNKRTVRTSRAGGFQDSDFGACPKSERYFLRAAFLPPDFLATFFAAFLAFLAGAFLAGAFLALGAA